MKVEITARVLHHDTLGTLRQGDTCEMAEHQARAFEARGWVRVYDTKVVVSQVENKSEDATPRRGRPRKVDA